MTNQQKPQWPESFEHESAHEYAKRVEADRIKEDWPTSELDTIETAVFSLVLDATYVGNMAESISIPQWPTRAIWAAGAILILAYGALEDAREGHIGKAWEGIDFADQLMRHVPTSEDIERAKG